jgi:hypothetical protein
VSFAAGMSWLKHRHEYARRFGQQVPDWVCVYDLPVRLPLVITALRIGWRLPDHVLVRDEFQTGHWSVWSGGG